MKDSVRKIEAPTIWYEIEGLSPVARFRREVEVVPRHRHVPEQTPDEISYCYPETIPQEFCPLHSKIYSTTPQRRVSWEEARCIFQDGGPSDSSVRRSSAHSASRRRPWQLHWEAQTVLIPLAVSTSANPAPPRRRRRPWRQWRACRPRAPRFTALAPPDACQGPRDCAN